MPKRVPLSAKPTPTQAPTPDDWVAAAPYPETRAPSAQNDGAKNGDTGPLGSGGNGAPEDIIKRLTIDVPGKLHTRIKSQCALRGIKMADEIRTLLEEKFPEES